MKYVFKKKILVLIFSITDFIGNILFLPIRFLFNKINLPIKKILVIRLDHIGDIVASTVVLKPLREKFPNAEINFMVPHWGGDILKNNPFIDNLIEFNAPWFSMTKQSFMAYLKGFTDIIRLIRQGKYDVAIDLRGDARHITAMFIGRAKYRIGYGISGMSFLLNKQVPYRESTHETDRSMELLKPFGISDTNTKVKLYLSDEDRNNADSIKNECSIKTPYIIIHPVPGHISKEWDAEDFAKVIEYVGKKGIRPILIGSEGDSRKIKEIRDTSNVDAIDMSGKTTLGVLGSLLKEASLFIGVDSGPAHMAAASGVPTIILFSGANNPDEWAPKGNNVSVVYPGEGNALSKINPDDVFKRIDKELNK